MTLLRAIIFDVDGRMKTSFRRRPHSRWLINAVQRELSTSTTSPQPRNRTLLERWKRSWDLAPFRWGIIAHAAAFVVALAAGSVTLFPSLTLFEVEDTRSVISTAWQVLAGFASIALAGLAVLMQLTSEPVVTSQSVRQVLYRQSQFRPILAFSIVGCVQIGIATLFLDQSEAAVIEVLVVSATVLWIGLSYARVGQVYAYPGEAVRLGKLAILEEARRSIRNSRARSIAAKRLESLVPHAPWPAAKSTKNGRILVKLDRESVLLDVDLGLLRDIVNELADKNSSAIKAAALAKAPSVPPTINAPRLRMLTTLDSKVYAGDGLFLLENHRSYTGDIKKLQKRLKNAVKMGSPND